MGSSQCKAELLRARHFICVQSSPLHFVCPESRITARYSLCLPPSLNLPRPSLFQLLHIFMSPGLSVLCSSSVTIIPPFLHSFMLSHIACTQCGHCNPVNDCSPALFCFAFLDHSVIRLLFFPGCPSVLPHGELILFEAQSSPAH